MFDIADSLWIDHILSFTASHPMCFRRFDFSERLMQIYLSWIWLPGTFPKIYYLIIPDFYAIEATEVHFHKRIQLASRASMCMHVSGTNIMRLKAPFEKEKYFLCRSWEWARGPDSPVGCRSQLPIRSEQLVLDWNTSLGTAQLNFNLLWMGFCCPQSYPLSRDYWKGSCCH